MNCNCKWTETVLAVIIFVLAVWPELLGVVVSAWVIAIGAILLLVHAWSCKSCKVEKIKPMPVRKARSAKKRRR
ncbi:hypothetical protein COU60_01740 [Candidatus Pacearchaeota archaeon CG10_big_fil_rev_8_21_14_0_10_34_76]|nr:MAG: hypothetical protein COU60_01740 [Candidatus Pacearchaeota archaeon CG10_big_fil_rev_8_21_14_0_10_34_76]